MALCLFCFSQSAVRPVSRARSLSPCPIAPITIPEQDAGLRQPGHSFRLPAARSLAAGFVTAVFIGLPLAASAALPSYVVTTAADDTNGSPGNCTNQGSRGAIVDASCSLRDALAAASASSGGSVTFSTSVFAAKQPVSARTIALGSGGTLTLPSNTSITGLTTGSGSSLANLVMVKEASQQVGIAVSSGATNTAIAYLTVTGSDSDNAGFSDGSAIQNDGVLKLTGALVTGVISNTNGGIVNGADGNLTILDSTITGNYGGDQGITTSGAGVQNNGKLTIINSTISGNGGYQGGGIFNAANSTLTLADSSVVGNNLTNYNPGPGGGILNQGAMVVTNSILADNYYTTGDPGSQPIEDECDGPGCPMSGAQGNLSGDGLSSTLPGSPAICAGIVANIPAGITTDRRLVARTTTYSTTSGSVTCVDSGALQMHYALSFSQQPPSSVAINTPFPAAVLLTESGVAVTGTSDPISLALAAGDSGAVTNGNGATGTNGVATFSNLLVNEPGSGDRLVASLTVSTSPPPAPLTAPLTINATSTAFDVTSANEIQVTIGTSPGGPTFTVDGTTYSSAVTLGWQAGSQHTIATTSPQTFSAGVYTFTSWSDGGAISHTVTPSAPTTYTASFTFGSQAVVNTNADDASGTASNCATGSQVACTLRDAIALAASTSPGKITFDPTVFAATRPAAARTITLTGGTLNISSATTISGPTTGSGITLTNLVAVNGNNQFTVFTTGASISLTGLTITNGNGNGNAGGIENSGALTVTDCTIAGNTGVGIVTEGGSLTLTDSAVAGNASLGGAGITSYYPSPVSITNSTISGNNAPPPGGYNYAISTQDTTTISSSTVIGTSGGIQFNDSYGGPLSVTNSIVQGTGCFPDGCPVNGEGGNVVVSNPQLVALANYGGPTPTQPALAGSPAICAGLIGDIPAGEATDQRGLPRTTTYNSTSCVDAGAVQTRYSLSFLTEPPANVAVGASFAAAVQLSESGSPFAVSGIGIPLALGTGDPGTLSGNSATTATNGVATYNHLAVSAAGSGDTLVAALALSATAPPISIASASSPFNVSNTAPVVPATPTFSPQGGTYATAQTVTLADATAGAAIYYTTDNSTPSAGSTLYTAPFQVARTETVKAIAILNGVSGSVASASYTISAAQCQTIDYSKGFTSTGLSLNGGAVVTSGLLRLTDGGGFEARSAFSSALVPVTSFTTDFSFQLVNPLADGITFTIQSDKPQDIGQYGKGLGYAGIPKSAALKFDLYNNNGEGSDSTGVYLNGAMPTTPAIDLGAAGIRLHSGHVFAVHLVYASRVTTATITDTVTAQSATASLPGDLSQVVGSSAYVGFTGGTGTLSATQNILTWSFEGGSGCAAQ